MFILLELKCPTSEYNYMENEEYGFWQWSRIFWFSRHLTRAEIPGKASSVVLEYQVRIKAVLQIQTSRVLMLSKYCLK